MGRAQSVTTKQDAAQEIIFTQANDYFDRIISAINLAKFSIELETYIFDDDSVGARISEALSKAAERGVYVRLLIDGAGVCANFPAMAKTLETSGVEVKIHRPFPWHFDQWPFSLAPSQGVQKFWYLLSFINQRNHRKLVMIDRKIVWVGSFNISQSHLPRSHGGRDWRDTAIELHSIDTRNAEIAFNACWSKWRKRTTANELFPSPFIYNFTRSLRFYKRAQLIKKILLAKDRVWITNAYFLPDAKLLETLSDASRDGVDVRILLPKESDIFFIPWASSTFYSQLLNSGVRIYEYKAGILHAKTILIDNWGCIGSSNWNGRSIVHDLELDYSVQLDESKQELTHQFLNDLKKSEERSPEIVHSHKLWQRLLGGFLLFILGFWV